MRIVKEKSRTHREFRQFMHEEVDAMLREFGEMAQDDPELQNSLAIAWIDKNAARFRSEWYGRRSANRAG